MLGEDFQPPFIPVDSIPRNGDSKELLAAKWLMVAYDPTPAPTEHTTLYVTGELAIDGVPIVFQPLLYAGVSELTQTPQWTSNGQQPEAPGQTSMQYILETYQGSLRLSVYDPTEDSYVAWWVEQDGVTDPLLATNWLPSMFVTGSPTITS